jgi:hypothetical protein
MKKIFILGFLLVVVFSLSSCAYKAYLGMPGKSIWLYPDIHEGVTEDYQCLECHNPIDPEGPPTPHPNFKGCLKCHNSKNIPK